MYGKDSCIKLGKKNVLFLRTAASYLICHRHASESLDGSKLNSECGCRLSHAFQQGVFNGGVGGFDHIADVTDNLQRNRT